MKTIFLTDLDGQSIEVTDLDKAIEQCVMCADSPFKMKSGHTISQYHSDMFVKLRQLKAGMSDKEHSKDYYANNNM